MLQTADQSNSSGVLASTALPQDEVRALSAGWKARAQDNIRAIEIVQQLTAEQRQATPAERADLRKFIGFSASELANGVFRGPGRGFRAGWESIGSKLEAIVSVEQLAGLAAATQYAHYSPEPIVWAVWNAVRRLGFYSGSILEPGCGPGMFMGLAPKDIDRASFTGVESEAISAAIASALYPEATIHAANFIGLPLARSFDLAIGNPPFSSRRVRLSKAAAAKLKERSGELGLMLHDYFIARSIEYVRPGGLAAFLTSHGTMDKRDPSARAYLASLADLIAAVRLPAGSMQATAGTEVVVDILFFRRRAEGETASGPAWRNTVSIDHFGDEAIAVNEYFLAHPQNVLGTHGWARTMYAAGYSCIALPGAVLEEQLGTFVAALPAGIVQIGEPPVIESEPITQQVLQDWTASPPEATELGNLKEGSFGINAQNKLFQVVNGRQEIVKIKTKDDRKGGVHPKHERIIRRFIAVRDALRNVISSQSEGGTGDQAALAGAYNAFVADFGAVNHTRVTEQVDEDGVSREIHRRPNLQPFLDDPDAWLVASIENYDVHSDQATPGPIFTQQVIRPIVVRKVENAADALAVCLDQKGRVDIDHIATLLNVTPQAAIDQLGDTVFLVPDTNGTWETRDAYLSGAVRAKLALARAATAIAPAFQRNVHALERVQPKDLNPSDVSARLGAPWIPTTDIEQFILETLDVKVTIRHSAGVATWEVPEYPFEHRTSANVDYGTRRRHAGLLLHDALNGRAPQLYDTVSNYPQPDKRVLNVVETEAANEKLEKLKAAFESWIWTDNERTHRLMAYYNEHFNDIVPREFDGSHLRLPGASSAYDIYSHQKRVIWRIISSGNTYIAHAVGAGKTICIAAAIQEQRRLGLVTKPMLVVPGHCLAQVAREYLQLYPNANILVADDHNFAKDKRHRFIAQATVGNWDCIIITHSAFKFIETPTWFEAHLIDQEVAFLETALLGSDSNDRTTRKRIELRKENLRQRLENLKARKDDMVTIEDMGIDQLVVDEAQEFRKLTFYTNKYNVKGIDPHGSQRAWDLYVKNLFIARLNPGRSLVLASGTPITNTLGEMFTIQRYLDPDGLETRHLHEFDAWSAAFGDMKRALELQPNGKYKLVSRFAEFVNVPELVGMFRLFADVLLSDDLRSLLQLPAIVGGRRQILTAPASDAFRRYQEILDERITAIQQRSRQVQPGDDILLSVITDGRHAAIDLRLVGYQHNEPENKLNLLISNVLRIYRETQDHPYYTRGQRDRLTGAGQLIFSDLGTMNALDKRGFSAYAWIRNRLIAGGVPAAEIVFIQDFKRASDKQAMFNRFNAGMHRILIGSSAMLGTGANVQKRLKALHHLDVPWLPSMIEQREGRIHRQGNQNDSIEIIAYATLGSMDAQMWGANERKASFISMAMRGDRSIRRVEDIAGEANDFALAKAIASGNPLLLQKAGLDIEIGRLRRLRSAHFDAQHALRRELYGLRQTLNRETETLGSLLAARNLYRSTRGNAFEMLVDGQTYTKRTEAKEAFGKAARRLRNSAEACVIGSLGGFDVSVWTSFDFYTRERVLHAAVDFCGHHEEVRGTGDIVARLENLVNSLDELIHSRRAFITRTDRRISEIVDTSRLDAPFEFEEELRAKESELRTIEKELLKEDDDSDKPQRDLSEHEDVTAA